MPRSHLSPTSQRLMRRTDERGATLVEVALVLPIFLLLVFGVIEFSYAASQNAEVRHAAEEGARATALGRATGTAVCGSFTLVSDADYLVSTGGALPDARPTYRLKVRGAYQSLTGLVPDGWYFTAEQAVFVEPQLGLPGETSSTSC